MVSIIMSAYNAEKTIKKAIKSCLNQTYKDIEIIVIDDCSKDKTGNIVKRMMSKDFRIKYIRNDLNLGAGTSRKIGVHNIKGEYSCFVDSDDYIARDYIKTLYNYAVKYDAELTCSGLTGVFGKKVKNKIPNKVTILEGVDKYKPMYGCYKFLTGCLVKSNLWDNVEYSDNRFIEDTPTLVKLIWFANKRLYIPYTGYYYVQNKNSLIHTSSRFKVLLYRAICAIDYVEFFKIHKKEYSHLGMLKNILNQMNGLTINKEEYTKYEDKFKYILDYINNYEEDNKIN